VFGAAARGEATEKGDVDFLVQMEIKSNLLDVVALIQDIAKGLGGAKFC